jgi:hypothetical protein
MMLLELVVVNCSDDVDDDPGRLWSESERGRLLSISLQHKDRDEKGLNQTRDSWSMTERHQKMTRFDD